MGANEKLLPVMLFVVTFALVAGLFIGLLDVLPNAQQNPNPDQTGLTGADAREIFDYSSDASIIPFNPDHQQVDADDLSGSQGWDTFTFTHTGYTDIECTVIRNFTDTSVWWWLQYGSTFGWTGAPDNKNLIEVLSRLPGDYGGQKPTDFVLFWHTYKAGTLGLERYYKYGWVDLDTIATGYRYNNETDTTYVDYAFDFHLRWFGTGHIYWEPGNDATHSDGTAPLWNNNFNCSVTVASNATTATMNPWTMLGKLITLQLPNVDPLTGFLIAVPFWLTISFVTIEILIRAFKPGA